MFKLNEIEVGKKFCYKDPAHQFKHDKDKIEERTATCLEIRYHDAYKTKNKDLPKLGGDFYIIKALDDKGRKVYLSVSCKVDYDLMTFFADDEEKITFFSNEKEEKK